MDIKTSFFNNILNRPFIWSNKKGSWSKAKNKRFSSLNDPSMDSIKP